VRRQSVSPDRFAVEVAGSRQRETLRARLAQQDDVEVEGETDDLLVLRMSGKGGDPRSRWQAARTLVGSGATVMPILTDEAGRTAFPTGRVVVRFGSEPTDAELRDFARRHDLGLSERNEFVATQATFTPVAGADVFLPDLVSRANSDDAVESAWAESRARYRRE
jgi:hypothetical protein